MRFPRPARLTAASAAVLLSVGLTACTSGDQPEPATSSPAPSPTVVSTTTTTPVETSEATETTATSTSRAGLPEDVAEVQEIFSPIAPASLFEEFDSCNASGLDNAWECSGREVGQFQFFESMSKAASTTQLITELRSSRVVEDTGRKVVGWSTLGTTAVITVVDNDQGLVMQQMVSSDRVDPEERIYELGLAEPPTAEEEPEETPDPEN
ncbi:hypothetical protein EAH68_11405 [Corynebacterium hylobatis]|uniref:Beta-N-acetylglucosaminidase n=1 Tax=Corynebacterium hylobatis TaxID=1859290 RepID=A0A3R9ZYS2_9CORY|nr:hypothetical protein [Corynebacterium hylobatis]RSZ61862.1 hypothetical protein EAH68_11405 [Corynebacterium hylobatis]